MLKIIMNDGKYKPSSILKVLFLLAFPLLTMFVIYPAFASRPLNLLDPIMIWVFWIIIYFMTVLMVQNFSIKDKNKEENITRRGS